MASIAEFLKEADEVFGFYFDIGMACHLAKERLEQLQHQIGASDDSPFAYKDGAPQNSPEQEIEESLHATTIFAVKDRMRDSGYDIQRAAETTIVFVYHIWEEKYRHHLIRSDGEPLNEINSDIMGDLRLLRNSIIHNKGVAKSDIIKCKVITRFKPGDKIILAKTDIYMIIKAIRSEFASYL